MTTDILNMFGNYNPGLSGDDPQLYARMMEMARPANLFGQKAKDARAARFRTLATNGCVYMGDFADDSIIGTALEMAGLPAKSCSSDCAQRSSVASPSTRSATRWACVTTSRLDRRPQLQDDSGDIRAGTSGGDVARRTSSASTSTRRSWTTAPSSTATSTAWASTTAPRSASATGRWSTLITGANEFGVHAQRRHLLRRLPRTSRRSWAASATSTQPERASCATTPSRPPTRRPTWIRATQGGVPVTPERPYKFCSDEFVGSLDCKPWDEGATQTEIIDNTIDRFKNYYFFDAFRRDRLHWTIAGYFNRLRGPLLRALHRGVPVLLLLRQRVAGDDSWPTTCSARRSIRSTAWARSLQTPEPGQHCATSLSPDLLVLPSQSGGHDACVNGTGMQVDVGAGKPYFIAFSPDYYYRITRAGSLYEKLGGAGGAHLDAVALLPRRHVRRLRTSTRSTTTGSSRIRC